jgi:hypothetical protein
MTDLISDSYERRERHPVPEWVERVCADFGITESGAPKYRVMWNPDRRRVMNIINPETNQHVQRNIMKYPRIGDRWILETLMPWEKFGIWHEAAFGPKPPDGEYVLSHVFQLDLVKMMQRPADENTIYMSLDDFGQDNLRLMLHAIDKSRALQAWQLRNYDEEMLVREEKEFHEQFENVYDDNMGELRKVEKAAEDAGLLTSLDPLPRAIEAERRRKGRRQGKHIVETNPATGESTC